MQTATDRAQLLLTDVIGKRHPQRAFDIAIITTLMTSIISAISQCRSIRNVTASEAVSAIRELPLPRKRRTLARQQVQDFGSRRKWRDAGGWELVDDAIAALDESDDSLIIGLMEETEADDKFTI
jgi:hypothetical protein